MQYNHKQHLKQVPGPLQSMEAVTRNPVNLEQMMSNACNAYFVLSQLAMVGHYFISAGQVGSCCWTFAAMPLVHCADSQKGVLKPGLHMVLRHSACKTRFIRRHGTSTREAH